MEHAAATLLRFGKTVANTHDPKLTDAELSIILDMYVLADSSGALPGTSGYVATYDWHGACAEAWRWKAAAAAHLVSFNADGSQFSANQLQENCLNNAAIHERKRQTGNVTL